MRDKYDMCTESRVKAVDGANGICWISEIYKDLLVRSEIIKDSYWTR